MNTERPVVVLRKIPGFQEGYIFDWRVDIGYKGEGPRYFSVEEANTDKGPWTKISPDITNYTWIEPERRIVNRDDTKYFRVKLKDDTGEYYSPPIKDKDATDLRRELLLKEILRREKLVAKVHNGVEGSLYLRSRDGVPCTNCLDPITGAAMQGGFCHVCGGTRKYPPLYGPYPAWLTFGNTIRVTKDEESGIGKATYGKFEIRVASPVQLKSNDIIEDRHTKRLYYIATVQVVAEVTRSPAIQVIEANELPTADPLYDLDIFSNNKYVRQTINI